MDEDKYNVSGEMGVIIYGSFLISNSHYGGGGGKVTPAWEYMEKGVKGGESPRSYLQKGGSGFMLILLSL